MTLGILYAFAAALLWGMSYTLDQKILGSISPLVFLFFGNVLSLLILFPFVWLNADSLQASLKAGRLIWVLAVIALLLGTMGNLLIYYSISSIGAATASLIEITYPLVVVLFSLLLYRTVPNAIVLLGGLLIFAGSALIAYFGR